MLNKVNFNTQGGISGGFRGSQIEKSRRLSNGWTDWHQIWYTSADSSGNGHRLNTIRPSTWGGGLGGHKSKNQGKIQTAGPIGTQFVDSSGNGYTPNKLPRETQGGTWGILGDQTIKGQGKLSNGWTDWHQLWFTSADSSGNRYRLNTSRTSIPQGACRGGGGLGGHKFKTLGKLSKGWSDLHQIWYTSVDSSGNGHRLKTIRPTNPFWVVLWDQQFKRVGNLVKRLDRLGINFAHIMQMNLAMDTG